MLRLDREVDNENYKQLSDLVSEVRKGALEE